MVRYREMLYTIAILSLFLSLRKVVAKEISVDGGKLSFTIPNAFTELTPAEIALKFPTKQAPRFVVGDKMRTTTIAYDIKAAKLPSQDRETMRVEFTKVFDRVVPGIKWIKNEVVTINGFQWVHFEMTSNAVDTDIHNLMLMAPYSSGMVVFNFNSTKSAITNHMAAFRKSMATIRVQTK